MGTMIWSDCSYYDGEFRLGVIKGRGVYSSGNGYSLMGYVIDNRISGFSSKRRCRRIKSRRYRELYINMRADQN